ncbi:MAG: imidazolonepropionase [Halobacteriovoraceae bacterium]|jgi:imidazolonepropionase|nr:imidazolonepropionase [Halobacteriovoraceae bacterium]
MSVKVFTKLNQIATLSGVADKDGRKLVPDDLSIIADAAIAFDDQKIHWVGKAQDLPSEYQKSKKIELPGHVLTPQIVDCHTHLIFGGDRAKEYSLRLDGADYQEIAKAGGGILNTMNGTNALSADQLFELTSERIERLGTYGVGTIEIKSGYGLNFESEYQISHIINKLKVAFKDRIQIKNTYMAAHAVPKEFAESKSYISQLVLPLLEKLASENILDAVDIFHEEGYFDSNDTQTLFESAKRLGIPVKSHADEFQDNAGAELAVKYQALSTDHLLCTSDRGIKSLAESKTVATLLPGTGSFLGKPQANARKFLDAGCKVAIASDYNPGSCHWDNVLQIAAMSAPLYRMNSAELWSSITHNAAHALGITDQGALVNGLASKFSLFKSQSLAHITYSWGRNSAVVIPTI